MDNTNEDELCASGLETCDNFLVEKNCYSHNIAEFKAKVTEISNYLSGPARLELLYANKSDSEEIIYLLLNMMKQFKNILTELGKSCNKEYSFHCSVCDDKLTIPHMNFWEALQNHEHVEEMYCKGLIEGFFPQQQLNESLKLVTEDSTLDQNSLIINKSNCDSESDSELQVETNFDDMIDYSNEQFDESCVNSFRFNFVPLYDDVVQSKLYPEKTIQSLKKYDRTIYPTIIILGPCRAACLLCPCDLVSRAKIRMGKHFFIDHIAGNRHMKQAELLENINALVNFHETFLAKEPTIQAHQVYFRPDRPYTFSCILCGLYVESNKVESHILSDGHKLKVLNIFQKKNYIYYLVELQIQLYGIMPNPKETTPTASPSKTRQKNDKNMRSKKEIKTDNKSETKSQPEESPHNIIKSIKNPSSESLSEILPNRYKRHSQHFFKEKDNIICKICQVKLSKDISKIIPHIYSSTHLDLSRIPLVNHNYFCEVCNLKIPDEIAWLKHFADASKLHAKLPESRRNKTAEYECTKCCTVIFGDELSLSRHLYTKGVKGKMRETKLASSVLKVFKNRQTIEEQGAKLISEANETLKCNGPTTECCQNVEKVLSTLFVGCKVYPFGSRISGLGNQKSDLDLFLDIGGMYPGYTLQDSISQIQIVKKVASIMCKLRDEFQDVLQIPTARTPIVKFRHKKTGIDCDLSFRHGLSVENTKFLRFCFDLQPISQPFILILKMWSHQNDLSEYITTYALAIMGIFYLQSRNHLLSIKKLRQLNESKGQTIAGWETLEYTVPIEEVKKHIVPYTGNLVELLRDFFLYYSKFVYPVDVICPLLGHCIKKKDFNNDGKNLPPEMNSYRAQLHAKEPELFRNASPLCIQDPFDLSHNLTKALQAGILNKIRTLCDLSYKQIQNL